MEDWTVLMMGDHLGYIQKDGTWGDSTVEKAKPFKSFFDAVQAASDAQGKNPDINQVRLIRADFGK